MNQTRNIRLLALSSVLLVLAAYVVYGVAFLTPEPFIANSLSHN